MYQDWYRYGEIEGCPGALVKILVKMGKKCYKANFFQNSYVISCIITYQKPKKILLELISEIASQNV